ncbi:MAG: hypothetical protein K2G89_08525 [Lachnospiraceae bacterium]|nr:hypothetical protein [Lachnospiraceae bacterium]
MIFIGKKGCSEGLCKENSERAFSESHNKRFDYFRHEMAEVMADAFQKEDNVSKCVFSRYFDEMWDHYTSMSDVDIEKTVNGFKKLKFRLESIYNEYKKQKFNIAAKHTETFINVIDKLIAMAFG